MVGGKHDRSEMPWLEPPQWVQRRLRCADGETTVDASRDLTCRVRVVDDVACISVRAAEAARLVPLDFQRRVIESYEAVIARLGDVSAQQPVRFWNYIPRIGDRIDDAMDRYMLFNAGRFAAYAGWHGAETNFPCCITTASGVGHEGDDLYVHCLATVKPGEPIENPRQVPAYRYSSHYGPYPPSFARATRVPADALRLARDGADHDAGGATPLILVGGTASIRGERSRYLANLHRQLQETFRNMAALMRAAVTRPAPAGDGDAPGDAARPADSAWLGLFRNLCVYYVHDDHLPAIMPLVEQAFDHADDIEYRRATLCRPELLVEIEGVATGQSSHGLSADGHRADAQAGNGHPRSARRAPIDISCAVHTP